MTPERPSTIAQVELPGGIWTPKEFVVREDATEEELFQSVVRLNKLNLSSRWALGDLGIAIQERKRVECARQATDLLEYAATIKSDEPEAKERKRKIEKEAAELEKLRVPHYTSDLAEKLGVDDGYWRHCVQLARAFKPCDRYHTLSPAHHEVALKGAGGAKFLNDSTQSSTEKKIGAARARVWLEQAEREGLSASELRRRVNISLATHTPAKGKPEADPFEELTVASQWAIRYKSEVENLTKEQAVRVLTLMRAILELGDALRERCEA